MRLGRGEEQVTSDGWVESGLIQVSVRRGDEPGVLVQHQAALDVVAEVFAVTLREAERFFEQLIAVEGSLEGEEQVGAQTLGLQVGRRQLRARADILRKLSIILPGEGRFGHFDEVFPFAMKVGGAAVGVFDGEELGALAQPDGFFAQEEVGRTVHQRVGQVEIHVHPPGGRDAVHEPFFEVVDLGKGHPEQGQEDGEEQTNAPPDGTILTLFIADDLHADHPQQDGVGRA